MEQIDAGRHLEGLLRDFPTLRAAALVSRDGVPMAARGLDDESADTLAAMAAGICAMTRRFADRLGEGTIRSLHADLGSDELLLMPAMDGLVLAVLRETTGGDGAEHLRERALRGLE